MIHNIFFVSSLLSFLSMVFFCFWSLVKRDFSFFFYYISNYTLQPLALLFCSYYSSRIAIHYLFSKFDIFIHAAYAPKDSFGSEDFLAPWILLINIDILSGLSFILHFQFYRWSCKQVMTKISEYSFFLIFML